MKKEKFAFQRMKSFSKEVIWFEVILFLYKKNYPSAIIVLGENKILRNVLLKRAFKENEVLVKKVLDLKNF